MDKKLYKQAACRSGQVNMYPMPKETKLIREAIELCSTCDIKKECLNYAHETQQRHGVWGGIFLEQRQRESRYD